MERAVQTCTQGFAHNSAPFQFKCQSSNCTSCCLPQSNNRLQRTIYGTMADSLSKKRPRQLKAFDPVTKIIRDAAVKLLAEIYLDHTIANGGKCTHSSASSMNITRHDSRHKDIIHQKRREQLDVSSSLMLPTELMSHCPQLSDQPSASTF